MIYIMAKWQNWVIGILGLLVVLTPFLGFTASIERVLLVIFGLVIAVLAFWGLFAGEEEMPVAQDSAPASMPAEEPAEKAAEEPVEESSPPASEQGETSSM